MGRPSTFTQETADEICERLASGEPLAKICRDEHMPAYRTVSDWRRNREEFSAQFACAREDGHDAIAARAMQTTRGKGPDEGGDSSGDVQRDKLIVETDLKLLAKWDRRYSDSMKHELSGPDGQPLDLADTGAAARMAALLEAVRLRAAGTQPALEDGSAAGQAFEPED